MQCSAPLFRVPLFPWEKPPRDVKVKNGAVLFSSNSVDYDFIMSCFPKNVAERLQLIPCGKCMACRINSAEQWALRCALELKEHKTASFLTLTYDDDHLHYGYRINTRQKTVSFEPSLCKRDIQLFNKRLRKYCANFGLSVRVFGCGEYGGTTARPHYHGIYFGLPPFPDQKLLKRYTDLNANEVKLYTSEILQDLWGNGLVSIGEVNFQSISYVARYTTKKFRSSYLSDDDREFYDSQVKLIQEEYNSTVVEDDFLFMSRRPGIARKYFDQNARSIYANDKLVVSVLGSFPKVLKPCRYYDRLYDIEYPGEFAKIKTKRAYRCSVNKDLLLGTTDLKFMDSLAINDRLAKDRLKKLPRNKI